MFNNFSIFDTQLYISRGPDKKKTKNIRFIVLAITGHENT